MSHVNTLLPVIDVDRKPFPFPVSETAAAVYGFGDGGPSSAAVEIGSTSNHSPFAAASPPPWHRLPQPKRSWYLDPGLDQSDCKVPTSLSHSLPHASVSGSISPRAVHHSYGYRTWDDRIVTGGLFLSHSSNASPQLARNDSSLPASCYLGNAGKSRDQNRVYFNANRTQRLSHGKWQNRINVCGSCWCILLLCPLAKFNKS